MKVVLATAPRALGEIERAGSPFLGIGYVASYLEKFGGHNVVIVDAHTDNLTAEQATEQILLRQPQVVGFTATAHNRLQCISVIKLLKKKNPFLLIMVGGPFFSLTDRDALEMVPEIDCVVRHEGEIIAKEFLDAWPDQNKLKNVLGISYRASDGRVVSNPDRPFLEDWSQLPFPAWHLYDLSKYKKKMYGADVPSVGIISARGCPNVCTFCCNAAFCKSTLRLRNYKNFVDELEFLNKNYGLEAFNFLDDTLNISKKHIMDICGEIISRGLRIKWDATARVNTIDEEMVDFMKKAGCIGINFGVESGSPRILQVIKKGIILEQVRKAVQICSRLGLLITLNFIVNLPEETMDDLKMTADLMKELDRLPKVNSSYGFALVYPQTEMERFAKENNIMPKNFSWNSPYRSEKYRVIGQDPSLFYMEWPGKEVEKVKAFMVKRLMTKKEMVRSFWRKLTRIRNLKDIKMILKIIAKYLKL